MVASAHSSGFKALRRHAGLEILLPVFQRLEPLVRRLPCLVDLLLLTPLVHLRSRKAAGAMEVQVLVEVLLVKGVHLGRIAARDVGISHLLADDASVFDVMKALRPQS